MAENRAEKSGIARDVQKKLEEKFDGELAAKTLTWIRSLKPRSNVVPSSVLSAVQKIPTTLRSVTMDQYHSYLANGLVLGYLMSCLQSGQPKFDAKAWQVTDKQVFETSRQRERIGCFLNFCSTYGVGNSFTFQTDQLYEKTNLNQVIICLSQLGCEAQSKPGYTGPVGMWMAKHHENKRNFSEEQKRSGDTVIGLQMGTNKGANASGISFGAQRHIMDSH